MAEFTAIIACVVRGDLPFTEIPRFFIWLLAKLLSTQEGKDLHMATSLRASPQHPQGIIDGCEFAATVYNERSRYGIDGGRVSKLTVIDCATLMEIYNFDRGLDFDKCPPATLAKILQHCESLPIGDPIGGEHAAPV